MQPAPPEQAPPLTQHTAGSVTVYAHPDRLSAAALDDLFRLPSLLDDTRGGSSRLKGRITLWRWQPPWRTDDRGLVVRQYAHGGLLGRLPGLLFLGRGRMLHELRVSLHACAHGVPTATPLAVRIEKVCGPFVKAHFVSESIPGAVNLLELMEGIGADDGPDSRRRRRLAAAVASAVADMHDAGILHADLNLKNLLVRGGLDQPEVFVIDFDKARFAARLTLQQRMSNLLRLDRSVMKWAAARRQVGAADRLRVLRSYLGRYPQWRPQWRRIGRKYRSRHLLHRVSRQRD